ncbi:alpha/beta-hydrolase family protein [Neorhizobium sp. NCHU2750]|uniref:alpha/beta hydrolase n=1 Tax=Neorhizobium sp. NCHU2750 TaxID=1825976 RepID=UPI000E71681E|nr:membrane protein [Neorhizobium sp. NCHU2750]
MTDQQNGRSDPAEEARPRRLALFSPLSLPGLILGALLFSAALTPSLIPRDHLSQGALAGLCFFAGYAIGALFSWIWTYLGLPEIRRLSWRVRGLLLLPFAVIALISLAHTAGWQNSVRSLMGMPPVETAHPFIVCVVALALFVLLLAITRLIGALASLLDRCMRRYVPVRLAALLSIALTAIVVWLLASDILARSVFRLLDSSYRTYDALLEPDAPKPTDGGRTGSAASLIDWNELGRMGRRFVASGPDARDISAVTGRPAMQPIRVYVGLQSRQTPEERARLALDELKRQGGFDRSVLVVITPTGTGWVDPAAINAVEYLHDGDIASVAVQYSYLSSPLSLVAQSEYGAETARALFTEIYNYWTALPKDERPKLYLHGLSLGALNSEKSASLFEMIGDPVDGALWSGPPFVTPQWQTISRERNPGSLQRLPQFRDGRLVRFMDQHGFAAQATADWGPMRIVYLQYASDAIVFFDDRDFYRAPDWMKEPLGSDVSPDLRWHPIVTALQLGLDMLLAAGTPPGFGHVYAAEHYVDAWMAVTDVKGWSPQQVDALKQRLAAQSACDGHPCASPDAAVDEKRDVYEGRGG